MRATSPPRTIVDVAAAGSPPDQVEQAFGEAVRQDLLAPACLRATARGRGGRVARLIDRALDLAVRAPA
jgi:hypothetical protein